MKWWNSVIDWLSSNEGSRVLTDAILPFLAIVVAGVIAALIARSMATRVLDLHESESKSAAVASLIAVARKATVWHTLGAEEKAHSEHLGDESSVRLRLLPITGAGLAAAWAEHEIATIKVNAPTFSFQSEQSFNDLRDRLVEWQAKPVRARKLFRADLERWRVEDESAAKRAAGDDAASASLAASTASVSPSTSITPSESSSARGASVDDASPVVASPPAAPVAPASWAAPVVEPASSQASHVEQPAASSTPSSDSSVSAQTQPTSDATATAASSASSPTPPATDAHTESEPLQTRKPTGMVSTPVVQPPHAVAPASPSGAADQESGDDGDREPAFSAPVSAHQVRRRTSPESDAS